MDVPVLVSHLRSNNGDITAISFGQDNENFVVGSRDKTVGLYNVDIKKTRCIKFRYDFEVYDVDYSRKNLFGVVGSTRKIAIAEAILHNGHQETIIGHHSTIRSIHFSNSGNRIITGSDDKTIKMFRLGHRNFISSYVGHTNWIRCARFSPSNNLIASCAEDKTMKIFDITSGTLVHSFKDEKGFGNQLCWHKDGNTVAIAQENGRVKIFDIAQRKLIQYYRIYDCPVNSLDFHPSGKYLITGDEKGLAKILDLYEGRDIFSIQGHLSSVTATKFSNDGQYFVTGSKDKHLMIFKAHLDESCRSNELESPRNTIEGKENCELTTEGGATIIDPRKSMHYNFNDGEVMAGVIANKA